MVKQQRERTTKIVFDQSKYQQFTLGNGFRQMQKALRSQWSLEVNNDEISEATFEQTQIYVIAAPQANFNESEFNALRQFVAAGGSLFVMMTEDGEQSLATNLNYLLEEYGIVCNPDGVIRSVYYKYFDPKEALIPNGVLNRALGVAAGKQPRSADDNNAQSLAFVYPYGATLSLGKQAVALFSTGTCCYPVARPVAAFHQVAKANGGRVVVVGSVHMFGDAYFDKEDNSKVFDLCMKLLSEGIDLNPIDAADPEISDNRCVPDHIRLSGQLKTCLQELELDAGAGGDFMRSFDSSLYSIDLDMWPEVIRAYEKLSIPFEPLQVIRPALEVPLPSLMPAVFPPGFRELPPPQLELFDLDEAFSSADARLAQLATRCGENETERFVKEAGELLGIGRGLPPAERTAKRILEVVLAQLVEFKRGQPDAEAADDGHLFATVEDNGDDLMYAAMGDGGMAGGEEEMFSDLDDYDELEG
uniref:ABC_transp_aux domain-containing protein n=1 Tax=Panagrellus redivivus TaxID=6233 RepID=A0A7E4WBK4_PANRE